VKKRVLTAVVAAVVMVTTAAQAFAQAAMKPIMVASVAGYDELIKDVAYLGKVADMPDLAQSVEGLIGFFTQFQGLAGLDKSKPIGIALNSDGAQFQVVGFVPVTDSNKLLGALAGALGQAQDAGDGVKSITVQRMQLLIKEQNGWAFVGITKDAFNNLPKDPSTLLGDLKDEYDIGIRLFIQNIPAQFREIGLAQLRAGMQQGLQQQPNETDEAFQARRKMTEQQIEALGQVLEEMDELTIGAAIDSVEGNAFLDLGVSVKEGGKLAKQLASLENVKTKHAGFLLDDAIVNLHIASVASESDVPQALATLDAARKQAEGELKKATDLTDEERANLERWLGEVFGVIGDTLKGGSINGGATVVGEGPITVVAGATVVGAQRLEKVLKEAIAYAQTKPDFAKAKVEVEYDSGNHAGVRFHTVSFPIPDDSDEARQAKQVLGNEVVLTFGFGADRIYFAVGEDGEETITDVIDESGTSTGEELPLELSIALHPLVNLAAKSNPDDENLAVMAKVLAEGDDYLTIESSIEGRTQFLTISLEEGVLRAFGLTAKAAAAKKQAR